MLRVGLACGILAVLHNRAILEGLRYVDASRITLAARVSAIAVVMAVVAWLQPGMTAFFTAATQAPVTGLVLTTEMTGSVTWLSPTLGAVALAMLVARMLGEESIYDSLSARSVTA